MSNRIRAITDLGQAIWLDFISRELLDSGHLKALIAEGLTGMTSNPTIFQKSIASGTEYDAPLRRLAHAGRSAFEIYDELSRTDIADAADQLRPVFDRTGGADGFVSLEVSPALANDTEGTIAEARRLFRALARPNVMIKVPATQAGIPAVATLIGEGINVNVTLIFAIAMYEQVMEAYLEGLRRLRQAGGDVRNVASVASFFVSRVDTLVDGLLASRIQGGERGLADLPGKAAIANAKIAYRRYQEIFESPRFEEWRRLGARVQRPLWASTSTKNPSYPDTIYIDTLVGPNTVNTVPPQTLDAIRRRTVATRSIDQGLDAALATIERLERAGIRMGQVTDQLLSEGVKLFGDSFEKLLADVEAKRAALSRGAPVAAR
ncbi:MAG: transaldolase [Phycisphaerae bacterium]